MRTLRVALLLIKLYPTPLPKSWNLREPPVCHMYWQLIFLPRAWERLYVSSRHHSKNKALLKTWGRARFFLHFKYTKLRKKTQNRPKTYDYWGATSKVNHRLGGTGGRLTEVLDVKCELLINIVLICHIGHQWTGELKKSRQDVFSESHKSNMTFAEMRKRCLRWICKFTLKGSFAWAVY